MTGSPATLLVVSHDRRLLETVCDKLWVVDDGGAVAFDGGYRAWRVAVAGGWTVASALEAQAARLAGGRTGPGRADGTGATNGSGRSGRSDGVGLPATAAGSRRASVATKRGPKLSKDAYKRQRATVEGDLTRLGLRKSHLELALGDPAIAANYVEMRRVTSELADVTEALAAAEDAWLDLEERAP